MTYPLSVFVSWSGEASRNIAEALSAMLAAIFGSRVTCWKSYDNIKAGERWSDALDRQLDRSNFAIVCLVPNNLMAPWIHYEAGALSRAKDLAVAPYCVDLNEGELRDPLARFFQAEQATEDGTFELVKCINGHLGNDALDDTTLQNKFTQFWKDLETKLKGSDLRAVRDTCFECITTSELLKRESVRGHREPSGELQLTTYVYVNASEPIEGAEKDFSRRVMRNIRGGDEPPRGIAIYWYVFKLRPENGEHIADMIVNLATSAPKDSQDLDEVTLSNNILLLEQYLEVIMVEESYGLEYCILNANSEGYAHCYLRLTKRFGTEESLRLIDWASGRDAFDIAQQVTRLRMNIPAEKKRIIKSGKGCEFYTDTRLKKEASQFMDRLRTHIKQKVHLQLASKEEEFRRRYGERLIELCLGKES